MRNFDYDDRNLQRLFAEMDVKHRLKALRSAYRKEAGRVRKKAVKNLRGSIRSNRDLEKSVRALVFKKKAGFRVTVGTKRANKKGKGEAGFHTNRRGLKKPILIWAEDGTKVRRTRRRLSGRKSHSTGRMKRYGFIQKTADQVRESVTSDMQRELIKSIEKIAKKYGCD